MPLADEKWQPVVGFEGKYTVSDRGRVRSLHLQEQEGAA
ncbi:NUMOD4 domain-containing protein [Burkholderia sp. LMG 13014]